MKSKRLEAGRNEPYLLRILNLKAGFCSDDSEQYQLMQLNGIFKHTLISFVLELTAHNLKLVFFIKPLIEWQQESQYIKIKQMLSV